MEPQHRRQRERQNQQEQHQKWVPEAPSTLRSTGTPRSQRLMTPRSTSGRPDGARCGNAMAASLASLDGLSSQDSSRGSSSSGSGSSRCQSARRPCAFAVSSRPVSALPSSFYAADGAELEAPVVHQAEREALELKILRALKGQESAVQTLTAKLDAMQANQVVEGVQRWAAQTGGSVPPHLLEKKLTATSSFTRDMCMTRDEVARLAPVFHTQKGSLRQVEDEELIEKMLDRTGPLRKMGRIGGNKGAREQCLERMKVVVVQRGEEIVQRGIVNKAIYILLSGRAKMMFPRERALDYSAQKKQQKWELITIRRMYGRNLPNLDSDRDGGYSDPFALVTVEGLTRRTRTCFNTAHPDWIEAEFDLYFTEGSELQVMVMDDDTGVEEEHDDGATDHHDDGMGAVNIRLDSSTLEKGVAKSFTRYLLHDGEVVTGLKAGGKLADGGIAKETMQAEITFEL